MRSIRFLHLGLAVASLLLVQAAAGAQPAGAIVSLHYQQTGESRTVVAASSRGLVVIGADLGNFRAFPSSAQSQDGGARPFYWVADIDNDREDEYVFGGDPSFVLDGGGDPLFGALQGCDDFYAGNIIDDEVFELFCRRRNTLTVWNYDGQFLWEYSVSGLRLSRCEADDVDSDERLEFACGAGSSGWLLVDIANDEPVQEVPDNPAEVSHADPYERYARQTQAALSGETTFDIDGDGNPSETLLWNGGALTLRDGSGTSLGSAAIPESEIYSVEVADLNADGTPEVFVGGVEMIYVISPTGEVLSRVQGNPNALERDSRVTIESVTANGLEDSSAETARAAVEAGLSGVQRCYDRQMGSDPFIRVGSMFYELGVDGQGRISRAQRIHSSVANRDLESCIEEGLQNMRFSSAAQGSGTVSVRLGFDFVDR